MITKTVEVTQFIEVTVDESMFTDGFMEEFREHFYPFSSISDHIEHLAALEAGGLLCGKDFIEGYGEREEMGISVKTESMETSISTTEKSDD